MVAQTKVVAMQEVRNSKILDIFWRFNQQDSLTRLDMNYESKRGVKDDPKPL